MGTTRRAEKKRLRLLRKEQREIARAVASRLLGKPLVPKSITLATYKTKV